MKFPEKLKYLMDRERDRGADLCRAIKVHPSVVSRWLGEVPTSSGKPHRPTTENFLALARRYGVRMESLVDDDMELIDDNSVSSPAITPEIAFAAELLGPKETLRRLRTVPPERAEPCEPQGNPQGPAHVTANGLPTYGDVKRGGLTPPATTPAPTPTPKRKAGG